MNIVGIEKEYQETQKKHIEKVIKGRGHSTFYNPVLSMESRNQDYGTRDNLGTRGTGVGSLMTKASQNSPRNSVFIKRGGTVLGESIDQQMLNRAKFNRTVDSTKYH